jgi:hypothetical protein
MFALQPMRVSIPIALHAVEALTMAEFMLYDGYVQRRSYQFSAGPKWLKIEPGDVITLAYKGLRFSVRVLRTELGLNWQMQFTATSEENTIYIPSGITAGTVLTTTTAAGSAPPTVTASAPVAVIADVSDVSDANVSSTPDLSIRVGGLSSGFTGASVAVSYNNGSSWITLGAALASSWGSALNLPAPLF